MTTLEQAAALFVDNAERFLEHFDAANLEHHVSEPFSGDNKVSLPLGKNDWVFLMPAGGFYGPYPPVLLNIGKEYAGQRERGLKALKRFVEQAWGIDPHVKACHSLRHERCCTVWWRNPANTAVAEPGQRWRLVSARVAIERTSNFPNIKKALKDAQSAAAAATEPPAVQYE